MALDGLLNPTILNKKRVRKMIKYVLDIHYKYCTIITQLSISIIVVFKTNSCEPSDNNSGCSLPKKCGQPRFKVYILVYRYPNW
jgi:hypothetical protein